MSMPFDSCLAMHDCGGGNTQSMIPNYYLSSLRHVENTYCCIFNKARNKLILVPNLTLERCENGFSPHFPMRMMFQSIPGFHGKDPGSTL